MPEETLLAQDELLGVKVILVSDCEQQKSDYYVVHKGDTLQFMYFASCKEMHPFEYKEAAKISSKQVDKKGLPELILEYEYNNRGFRKELLCAFVWKVVKIATIITSAIISFEFFMVLI